MALEPMEPLAQATAQLRQDRPEPPPELVERVMRRVRVEARPGRLLTMPCAGGTAAVSEAALREALARVLDADGAVLVSHCSVDPARGGGVQVSLVVHARWESFEVGSPDLVRRRVVDSLGSLFGLRAERVDIAVEDVTVQRPPGVDR